MRGRFASYERLLILQCFLDDSFKTEEGGWFVLAGYIGTAETWAEFSTEWEERLPASHMDKEGKFNFKMSLMANSGYGKEQLPTFMRVIDKYHLQPISYRIHSDVLRGAVGKISFHSKSAYRFSTISSLRDTLYNLCLDGILKNMSKPEFSQLLGVSSQQKIEVICDSENTDFLILESIKKTNYFDAATNVRFESDRDFLPLQAADFLAWRIRAHTQYPSVDGIDYANMKFEDYGFEPKGENKIFFDWQMSESELVERILGSLRNLKKDTTLKSRFNYICVLRNGHFFANPWTTIYK